MLWCGLVFQNPGVHPSPPGGGGGGGGSSTGLFWKMTNAPLLKFTSTVAELAVVVEGRVANATTPYVSVPGDMATSVMTNLTVGSPELTERQNTTQLSPTPLPALMTS